MPSVRRNIPKEFKIKTVQQVVNKGHPVAEVSVRLGISQHSLYKWIKLQQMPVGQRQECCLRPRSCGG